MSDWPSDIPVVRFEDRSGVIHIVPMPELLNSLKLFRDFLDQVVEDWEEAAASAQATIDDASAVEESDIVAARAFADIQPKFLKCLFSYAFFFVATENAFRNLHEQIAQAREHTSAIFSIDPMPPRPNSIQKLRLVRNRSVAHAPSDRASRIDRRAAMAWQPLSWGRASDEPWDIRSMQFGALKWVSRDNQGKVVEAAEDLELPPIHQLHQECMNYLVMCDRACRDSLNELRTAISQGGSPQP